MKTELDEPQRRALRRRARIALLGALESWGGEATRHELLDRALVNGGFSERELSAGPPPVAAGKYTRQVDYELSWALTNLRRDGLVENPARSAWRLAGATAEGVSQVLESERPSQRLDELRLMPYREYLRTPEWRKTRAVALLRAGYSCSLDVSHTEDLEVHHRTYERLGEELETDLLVLCRRCHRTHHAHNGRPGRPSAAANAGSVAPPAPPMHPMPRVRASSSRRARVSTTTRRRAQNAAREFLVQLFALMGFVVGLLMGFAARSSSPDPAACHAQSCLSSAVVAQLEPLVLYAVGGIVSGGLIGVALALLVRFDRRP